MASIQSKHAPECATRAEHPSGFVAAPHGRPEGCTCPKSDPPRYVLFWREGKTQKTRTVGNDHREAMRQKVELERSQEEGTYTPIRNRRFRDFAEDWRTGLVARKKTTREGYVSTVNWASSVFGDKMIRHVTPDDLRRLIAAMEESGISPSTQAKHLRVLGTCFRSAIRKGYAGINPIDLLDDGERPTQETREAGYFLDAEIPKLLAAYNNPMLQTLTHIALETGMRQGELLALTWRDVELGNGVIRVRRSITHGNVSGTKNKEARSVRLSKNAVELLGTYWGDCGKPDDACLVFPGDDGSYLKPHIVLSRLDAAMRRAGIPKECPEGQAQTPRNFHSLRHTFARIAVERGCALKWLSQTLGHRTLAVTADTYSHFSDEAGKEQIEKMEGAFSFART